MLKVDTTCMDSQARQMEQIARELDRIASRVAAVNRTLRWNTSVDYAIRKNLTGYSNTVSNFDNKAKQLAQVLNSASSQYAKAEKAASKFVGQQPGKMGKTEPGESESSWWDRFFDSLVDFSWDDAYDWIEAFLTFDFMKGYWSQAQDPLKAFLNNFKNKTSPINKYFKETADDLVGKNGVGKTIASWAGVVVDLVSNGIDNAKEMKESGGAMSKLRAAAETLIETGVDTVMAYTAGAVLAAAISAGAAAVGATVAVPALVMTVVGGLIWTGVNAAVDASTGKDATEHITDFICDGVENIKTGAQKVFGPVGKWFNKMITV